MAPLANFTRSSIGKKVIMAATGLILFSFVVGHLLGNLQIFLGSDQLNAYAQKLREWPLLLWPLRVFLIMVLLVHIRFAFQLALENKKARPEPYQLHRTLRASYASRTMVISGPLIFLFIVYHLAHFTFRTVHPEFSHLLDAQGRHDVFSMVVFSFQNYFISGVYILAMLVLCFHLAHGLSSLLQTLGLTDEKRLPVFKRIGQLVALLIFLGYSAIPLCVLAGCIKAAPGVLS